MITSLIFVMSNTYVGNTVFVDGIRTIPIILTFLSPGYESLDLLNLKEMSTYTSLIENKLRGEYAFYALSFLKVAPRAITLAHLLKRLVIEHNNSNILSVAEHIGTTYGVKPRDALIVFQLIGEMWVPVFTNAGVVIIQYAHHMAILGDTHLYLMTARCRYSPILTEIRSLRQEMMDAGLGRNAVTEALYYRGDSYLKDHWDSIRNSDAQQWVKRSILSQIDWAKAVARSGSVSNTAE